MPPLSIAQSDEYDVLVVGASFAGLSFAGVAAALGLRVLVVERDAEIGGVVRTTGVLFSDVLDILDVPARFLMNAVRRIWLQPPSQPSIEIGTHAYRFYMADVTGMLRWMAEEAVQRGASVRSGSMFLDATREQDGYMRVRLGGPAGAGEGGGVRARILVGADGTHSVVAQRMQLERNTQFLAGAEWLVENVPLARETFYLVMSHEIAPGYCLWLAPHGDIAALGVAGHARAFNPHASLNMARDLFKEVADLQGMRVVRQKGGVIPTGGRLKRVYRDDELGCALLLGDAAGLCGAATGGGIYPALISGRLAAHAVASHVLDADEGAIKAYLRNLSQAGRLGHYLRIEDWLRWVLDRMKSDADIELLYGLFNSPDGRQVLRHALLEVPIIGMDSSFFSLLRGLLNKHPSIYGSALQAVWQRVTTHS
jgi:digeranylgeranylglycerophospholipid reductase